MTARPDGSYPPGSYPANALPIKLASMELELTQLRFNASVAGARADALTVALVAVILSWWPATILAGVIVAVIVVRAVMAYRAYRRELRGFFAATQ